MEENIAIFRRYIAEISCIEGFRHDISWRNIGPAIFRDFSREIAYFSRYIGDLAIYRVVNAGQRKSDPLQCRQRATVHALQCLHFLELRGFEPQTKRFGVHPLTTGLSCPLIYIMQQLYIYLNSLYKENIRIFLRAN